MLGGVGIEPPLSSWKGIQRSGFYGNLEVDRGAGKFGGSTSGRLGSLGGLARRICLEYGPGSVSPGSGTSPRSPEAAAVYGCLGREFRSYRPMRLPSQGTLVVTSGRREKAWRTGGTGGGPCCRQGGRPWRPENSDFPAGRPWIGAGVYPNRGLA